MKITTNANRPHWRPSQSLNFGLLFLLLIIPAIAHTSEESKSASQEAGASEQESAIKPLAALETNSSGSKRAVEALQAAESAGDKTQEAAASLTPAGDLASKESAQADTQSAAPSDQQQQEEIPSVSGLVSQDEANQQQQTQSSADEQQQQGEAEQQQQQAAAEPERPAGSKEPSRGPSNDNEAPVVDQFGRKAALHVAAPAPESQPPSKTTQMGVKGPRSLKRAFGGHMGLFGRKRSQTQDEQQQQVDQQVSSAPASTRAPSGSYRSRNHHYYYQTASTAAAPIAQTTRGRLKEADFPDDYREILVQPDQLERQQKQQQQQQQQYSQIEQQQQQTSAQEQPTAIKSPTSRLIANSQQVTIEQPSEPIEQQKIEQTGGEVPAGDSQTVDQSAGAVGADQQETSAPTVQTNEQTDGQQQEFTQPQPQQHQQPFIRLSNIATINSTSGSNSSEGAGMKLMRIYVIDLDQKLVVGGQQPQQEGASTSATTAAPAYSQQVIEQVEQISVANATADDQYTKASESSFTSSLPSTTSPLYTSEPYTPQYEPSTSSQNRQHTAYTVSGPIPDGYVLVDREQLNGNLSQLVSQMSQQEHYESQQHRPTQSNYRATQQHEYSSPAILQYSPAESASGHYGNHYGGMDLASGHNYSAQVSLPQTLSRGGALHYGGHRNTVAYPVQVQHQMDHQQHPVAHQVLSAYPAQQQSSSSSQYLAPVPQYIAPQYSSKHSDQSSGQEYELRRPQSSVASNYTSTGASGYRHAQAPKQQYDKQTSSNRSNYSQEHPSSMYQPQAEPALQHYYAAGPAAKSAPDRWRPLDYSAPAPSAYLQQAQVMMAAPQYTLNGFPIYTNSQRDHDVVSLAAPNGSYSQQLVSAPNQYSAYNYSTLQLEHAPLNYTTRSPYATSATKPQNYTTTGQDNYTVAAAAAGQPAYSSDLETNSPVPVYFASGPDNHNAKNHPSLYGLPTMHLSSSTTTTTSGNNQTHANEYSPGNYTRLYAQSGGTNEYNATYSSTTEQQYDTSPKYASRPSKQSTGGHKADQTGGSSYRPQQQMSRPQHSTGPYLAVSGPPVGDGVYEQEPESPTSTADQDEHHQPIRHASRIKTNNNNYQRPRANRPKAPRHNRYNNKYQNKPAADAQATEQAAAYGPNEYFSTSAQADPQLSAEMQQAMEQPHPPTPMGPQHGHRLPRPQMGVPHPSAAYYRPMGGPKSLLSWDTISSAASSAAKRLPSLSSILMPFNAVKSAQMYPTANYPAPSYGAPHSQHSPMPQKSAHYDRDVSGFHRPYPLRYMSGGSAHQADYSEATGDIHSDNTASEYSGDESADLNSSSSSDSQSDSDMETDQSDSSDSSHSSGDEHKIKLAANTTESVKHARPAQAELGDLAEINSETFERPPKSGKKTTQTSGKSPRPGKQLDSAHVAVLSSIDQQLEEQGVSAAGDSVLANGLKGVPLTRPPRRNRKQRPLASGQFVDPSISSLAQAGEPVNIDSLPMDQQRLLLKSASSSMKSPSADLLTPPSGMMFTGPEMDQAMRPRPPSSMQIGQYKITPQTQFVQQIIEPSRQMLGQYFKQYIGQLGQFAHG